MKKQVDIHDFKFKHKYQKGDLVVYNKLLFRYNPFVPSLPLHKVMCIDGDFIKVSGSKIWWYWWELSPVTTQREKMIYKLKFYLWYHTKHRKLK